MSWWLAPCPRPSDAACMYSRSASCNGWESMTLDAAIAGGRDATSWNMDHTQTSSLVLLSRQTAPPAYFQVRSGTGETAGILAATPLDSARLQLAKLRWGGGLGVIVPHPPVLLHITRGACEK